MRRANYDDGPISAAWTVTANDGLSRRFRIKDASGAVVADPESDGWVFFGQVRDVQGGEVVDDITFSFDGEWVTQQLPELDDGSYWWEKEVTPPGGTKRTVEAGTLIVGVDSAFEGGS